MCSPQSKQSEIDETCELKVRRWQGADDERVKIVEVEISSLKGQRNPLT